MKRWLPKPFWLVAALLVMSNVIMLLPSRASFFLILAQVMSPPMLTLATSDDNPKSLIVYDRTGTLAYGMGWNAGWWQVPLLQDYLENRRIGHLAKVGRITVWVQHGDQPKRRIGTCQASETWRPKRDFPIRFELPGAIDLPPGRYTVHALMFADPPWGWGEDPAKLGFAVAPRLKGAVLPGQYLLPNTEATTFTITIDESP